MLQTKGSRQMFLIRLATTLIGWGTFGGGLYLFRENGPVAQLYKKWWSALPSAEQKTYPAEFDGLLQYVCGGGWILFWGVAYIFLLQLLERLSSANLSKGKFAFEVGRFFEKHFNSEIDRLQASTVADLHGRAIQDAAVVGALYGLRDALVAGYKSADIKITLMLPEKRNQSEDVKLYIEFYANAGKAIPRTKGQNFGFNRGEGFAGFAWESTRPQIGGKSRYLIFRDRRYIVTPEDQSQQNSFCSIPVFDEGGVVGSRLLAVLNIDSPVPQYFPVRGSKQRLLLNSIEPFIAFIRYQLKLRVMAMSSERPRELAPLEVTDRA